MPIKDMDHPLEQGNVSSKSIMCADLSGALDLISFSSRAFVFFLALIGF